MGIYEGGTPHPQPVPMIARGSVPRAADVSGGQHIGPPVEAEDPDNASWSIHANNGGRMRKGTGLSLAFADGKGVAGRIAGVDIDPGGASWRVVVTHDGEWPNDRPETPAEAVEGNAGDDAPNRLVSIRLSALKALQSELGRLRDELRSELEKKAARVAAPSRVVNLVPEYPRQRVVTEHAEDGSVTIRVELRKGNQ